MAGKSGCGPDRFAWGFPYPGQVVPSEEIGRLDLCASLQGRRSRNANIQGRSRARVRSASQCACRHAVER